ncbi:MAG: DNA/RNA nuclease SfsA [Alphaproteobacteria bacterium]|nr:DNA/RNA nuclease SfsA [Alphaproteobacteria bacterium]
MLPFLFKNPLVEGVIEKRKTQFTIQVEYNGESYHCHCPSTGRIGNLELSERPCLLSPSADTSRKTAFTVEAISLNKAEDSEKKWIGINQNAANRYVEHSLRNGDFLDMIGDEKNILREQVLGNSKLDFLVGNTYIEVKTPLLFLQTEIPDYVKTKKFAPFSATDRMTRHLIELGDSVIKNQRAIMLLCFIYDNPGFEVMEKSKKYYEVKKIVDENLAKGVEMWQANFKIDPIGVTLEKYFRIEIK